MITPAGIAGGLRLSKSLPLRGGWHGGAVTGGVLKQKMI